MCCSFLIAGKTVAVWPAAAPGAPVLYLNAAAGEGEAVRAALQARRPGAYSLVCVSGLDWGHDLTPWGCPPPFRGADPCTGGADGYLRLLAQEILPAAESRLPGPPCWRGLGGYSLAGLFALYALYRTPLFARIASVSGSLWYPGLMEFLAAREPAVPPQRLYFSIGRKEDRTRNPLLQPGRANTEAITAAFAGRGVQTKFELNPGTHFTDPAARTAAGLAWLLGC